MDETYQYPPQLMALLKDTIPLLCRSKSDLLGFFRGAGVTGPKIEELASTLSKDRHSINKFQIASQLLIYLNEGGDRLLRQRRELLKRVVEFENFSACWSGDQLRAKGLVAEIREVINVKDSFTRMNLEREREKQTAREKQQQRISAISERRAELSAISTTLSGLISIENPHQRGKSFEEILNRLFAWSNVLIRESFVLRSPESGQTLEQIDGAIELDGSLYLVEAKWWSSPIGVDATAQHLVRVHFRSDARGLFISASGFTEPAVSQHRDALATRTVVLCELQELVRIVEYELDLRSMLRSKAQAAVMDKNPLHRAWAEVPVFGNE